MDGGAWYAAVHGVARSRIRLSDFTFTFHFHALEKEMATHSSVLAWRIPGMGEPGGLPSVGSHRVGYYWSDLAAAMVLLACKVVLVVKNLPAMHEIQEAQIWFLCQEDDLEEKMATHSNILAGRNPWAEDPRRATSLIFMAKHIPLQY